MEIFLYLSAWFASMRSFLTWEYMQVLLTEYSEVAGKIRACWKAYVDESLQYLVILGKVTE